MADCIEALFAVVILLRDEMEGIGRLFKGRLYLELYKHHMRNTRLLCGLEDLLQQRFRRKRKVNIRPIRWR